MVDTTTQSRPAWLVLTVIAVAVVLIALAANLVLGGRDGFTQSDTQTDNLVTSLCEDTPDC